MRRPSNPIESKRPQSGAVSFKACTHTSLCNGSNFHIYWAPDAWSHHDERGYELLLVSLIRERVGAWRNAEYPGTTRTTLDLLAHWRREGRVQRLFFAQMEPVETVIFLKEARFDFRQGIDEPREVISEDAVERGYRGFERTVCQMATGSGKTTVMAMLAAWSILNKVNNRADGRFSDAVLVVTPLVPVGLAS